MNATNMSAVNGDPDTSGDDTGDAPAAPAAATKKAKSKGKGKAKAGKKPTAKAKDKTPAKEPAAAAGKGKSKAKVAKSGGKKTTSKANGAAKDATKKKAPKERSASFDKAEDYARKIFKDYGAVTVIRAVSQKFGDLARADVLALAEKLDINKFTASRQFHVARSGEVEIDLNSL